jgi:transcription-repair coupling factor (superfamily II helicase)
VNVVREILERVNREPAIQSTFARISQGHDALLVGAACSAKAMILEKLHRETGRPLLAIVPTQEEAESLLGDLEVCAFDPRTLFFPETEVVPYDPRSPHVGLLAERIVALDALRRGENAVTVTTARALSGRVPRPEDFARFTLSLSTGLEIPLQDLAAALAARGFRRERLVEEIGAFAVRGGLLDLYPFGSRHPVRVELFGDVIESIRLFDPASQRTVEEISSIEILPQREVLLTPDVIAQARTRGDLPFDEGADPFVEGIELYLSRIHPGAGSLLGYFSPDGIVVLDDPGRAADAIAEVAAQTKAAYDEVAGRGHDVPVPSEVVLDEETLVSELRGRRTLRLALFAGESAAKSLRAPDAPAVIEERIVVNSQETFRGSFSALHDRLRATLDEESAVYLLCDNQGQKSRLEELLEDLSDRIHFAVAPLRSGFSMPSQKLVVLTDHELFARTGRRYRAFRYGGGAPIHDYTSLTKGDYVVHVQHGVGRYDGIHRIVSAGVDTECLLLRYQGTDVLYVPIDQLNLVQKYIGGESGEAPIVTKLGSGQWERTKARAKKAVEKMARQLLEIHAARMSQEGHAFPPDGEWQREMEASFIYEETPDQRTATDAVKRDLEDRRPMDRLICGDVGYGKTEVAIRAAFKVVGDGRQVAVLVPTTILAQQHLNTFRERLRAYPVKVDMLSRFRSPKEQKAVVRDVAEGNVDIVIGTHRLLSKDIHFKNLGLVIVDEEQRFGVRHKERLKELRKLVDVLTLTATPIPRTLNMALMGLRDISVINTPPPNKLPIVTEVVETSDEVIKKAILREIQRGGQVFFVHNRVQSIEGMAQRLRDLVPELRFDVAHGQMAEGELERVMMEFLERKSDVLVSTMIIESGLDLPNVNTILIHRADTFGLAQLYQLRGRVGRSNHRAFAHLLIPSGGLSDIARKRLRAIQEFSELGSGFRLAMRDMEIRGVGNFLGPEQSGHVNAIGYDLYCQMLREAVAESRGEEMPEERMPVKMDVEIDAYLPEEYIDDPDQRILFYKRLADLSALDGLRRLSDELADRYGKLPRPAQNLLRLKELRLLAESSGVDQLRVRATDAMLRFTPGREPKPEIVREMVRMARGSISFQADGPEGLRVRVQAPSRDELLDGVEALLQACGASVSLTVSHELN